MVDLNRSASHGNVFSEFTRDLGDNELDEMLARYHSPYRADVEGAIAALLGAGRRVLHLSSHSFTPVLAGDVRTAEIGVLYDPKRAFEAETARILTAGLKERAAPLGWRVRRNYPYVGYSDGLTTSLRRRFPASRYAGIELEMNQSLLALPGAFAAYQLMVEEAVKCVVSPCELRERTRRKLSASRRRRST